MPDGTKVIDDYMARDLVTFEPTDDIHDAVTILAENRISGAPVVDVHGQLLGIITEKDCFKVVFKSAYNREWGGVVAEFMTMDVHTLASGTSVVSAAETFANSPYKSYPVLKDGRLVGLISRLDIMRALTDVWGQKQATAPHA